MAKIKTISNITLNMLPLLWMAMDAGLRGVRPRVWGHVRGSSIVSEIVEEADDYGLSALTLYAFSTENWSRPPKK